MSTPSGKPSNPIDLSAYEPRLARGQATAERHTSGYDDPFRSAYAPKRPHEPAGVERHRVENDRSALRSPTKPRDNPPSHRILSSLTTINPIATRHLRRRSGEARPPSAMTSSRMIVISSGLKPVFAGCSARKRPRGCPVPPLYLPCRGSLPSMQQAIVTAAKCRSISFGLRARWSPNIWRLHLQ